MPKKIRNMSRRNFLKTATLAGVGSIAAPLKHAAGASNDVQTLMPTRPFGKTGIQVPMLGFGGSLGTSLSSLLLRQAVKFGVTYWDTAHSYMGGNSEKAFGKFFAKFPDDRKKIFLVTKSHAWDPEGLTRQLNQSLKRMRTDYIDLFFIHGIYNIDDMDEDTRRWAEKAKSEGKIRLFGFSTHSNMEACLLGAARLNWVDGIMMTYNYRLMQEDRMKRAVDACAAAGIGLMAMKTQGGGQVKTTTRTELELAGRFIKKGYTDAQARLKSVWENPHIASICSEMPNTTILMSNVAAAMNKTSISSQDMNLLHRYAVETGSSYCAGCRQICESSIAGRLPIGDVMRYLMYCHSYGDRDRAVAKFRRIPAGTREQMAKADYSMAEKRCPQKIAIGSLMKTALKVLS
jgi:predicted aldo/keto reductase-like oxidoreductase